MTTVRTKVFEGMVRFLNVRGKLEAIATASDDESRFIKLVARQRRWDQSDPPGSIKRNWEMSTQGVDGKPLHTLKRAGHDSKRAILYLHGGAYMFGPFRPEWAMLAKIAEGAGCDFTVFDYPKAPEHQAMETVAATIEAYRAVAEQYEPSNITLMGSSSGGGLVIAVLAAIRDAGEVQPKRAILISPAVDMMLNEDLGDLETRDVLLSADFVRLAGTVYAGSLTPADPRVSPIHSDLYDLAPLSVLVGSEEILLPSVQTFVERALAAGNGTELIVGEGQQHTWPTAPTPEGKDAVKTIISILGR